MDTSRLERALERVVRARGAHHKAQTDSAYDGPAAVDYLYLAKQAFMEVALEEVPELLAWVKRIKEIGGKVGEALEVLEQAEKHPHKPRSCSSPLG